MKSRFGTMQTSTRVLPAAPALPARCSHITCASKSGDYPPNSPYAPRAQKQNQPEKRKPGQPRKRLIRPEGLFDKPDLKAARKPLPKPVIGSGDDTVRSKDKYTSDFIWNTNWQARFDFQQQERKRQKERKLAKPEKESGHLSFTRVSSLNDMSVDLSEQLAAKPKPLARNSKFDIDAFSSSDKGSRFADRPSPHVSHKWERSRSYANRSAAMAAMTQQDTMLAGEQEAREAERARFEQLRAEYGAWTAGAAAAGFAYVYSSFSKDAAASYLIGALGGIAYLRMLHCSVSSIGATSLGAAAGGMASQPRLLIPVILTLFYNRYNTLYADSIGIHMELLPMLAGFFTYKAGVLGRASIALARELRGGSDSAPEATPNAPVSPAASAQAVANAQHSSDADTARPHAQPAVAGGASARPQPVVAPRSPAAAAHAVDALVDKQMRSAL